MTDSCPSIFEFAVHDGLAVAWVNSYSAVAIKSADTTLLIDPVSMDVPAGAALDLIAISHDHLDHWDPKLVLELQKRTGAKVVTSAPLASRLESFGVANVAAMRVGESVQVRKTTLRAERCDHAATEPLSFSVEVTGGVSVYLPGDTTPFPEMAECDAEVVFWTGTSLTGGAEIARQVNPLSFLTYAIDPPKAGERAIGILNALAPNVRFHALRRHQVFQIAH